jgi:hypothetical protein
MTDQMLSDLLEDAGSRIPVNPAPHSAILARAAHRRRRRTARWIAAAAVATATAAIVAVGVTQIGADDSGSSGLANSPIESFTQARVTYAEDSTIHYGDQTIDVSPHEVVVLVQTDDGFVFVDQNLKVHLTNGRDLEQIGQTSGFTGDLILAADDTGSYVGWIDGSDAVVYDTATGAEVLREPVPGSDEPVRAVAAIDDDRAYVETVDGVDVWNLEDQTKTTITRPNPDDELGDVANGYYLWHHFNGSSVVSRDPEAEQPVFGKIGGEEADLSPDAKYVGGTIWLFERATSDDITPRDAHPLPEAKLQWLDNDRYVADTVNIHTSSPDPDPHDLLICMASKGTCSVVVESLGYITYPDGIANEGAWEG